MANVVAILGNVESGDGTLDREAAARSRQPLHNLTASSMEKHNRPDPSKNGVQRWLNAVSCKWHCAHDPCHFSLVSVIPRNMPSESLPIVCKLQPGYQTAIFAPLLCERNTPSDLSLSLIVIPTLPLSSYDCCHDRKAVKTPHSDMLCLSSELKEKNTRKTIVSEGPKKQKC